MALPKIHVHVNESLYVSASYFDALYEIFKQCVLYLLHIMLFTCLIMSLRFIEGAKSNFKTVKIFSTEYT